MTRPPDGVRDTVLLAEEAVLAACLLDDDAFGIISTIVSSGDFYLESNRMMFAAIAYLAREQQPVTTVTLAHELAQREQLDAVGAEPAIQLLIGAWYTGKGVEAAARIVKQDSTRRQLLQQASKMAAAAGRGNFEEAREMRQLGPNWWEAYETDLPE